MLMYAIRNKDTNSLMPLDGARRILGDKEEASTLIRLLSHMFPAICFELWEINMVEHWEGGARHKS